MLEYSQVKSESDRYYEEKLQKYQREIPLEIEKARLYELVLNILNQDIFKTSYEFKERDFDYIIHHHMDIGDLIRTFEKYLPKDSEE